MKRLCLAVLLIPAVLLLGCAAPAPDTEDTPAAGSESKDTGQVFEDDFESGETGDWSEAGDETAVGEESGEAGDTGEAEPPSDQDAPADDEGTSASHAG